MKIPVHPIADMWPPPCAEDFEAIRDAIAREGLLVPVITWRGQLVDGRQRVRACNETGTEIRTVALPDDLDEHAVAYHVAALHSRRNLKPSQREAVGALLVKRYEPEAKAAQEAAGARGAEGGRGRAKPLAPNGAKGSDDDAAPPAPDKRTRAPKSAAKAAKAAGASTRGVERALRIMKVDPDLYALVLAGKVTVSAAEKLIKRAAAERKMRERLAAAPAPKDDDAVVILPGDAVELMKSLRPNTVACLLTDPPYGLETHRTRQGGHDYADGEEYAIDLLTSVIALAMPVLTDDAHVYVFSGYSYLERFRAVLIAAGLDVQPWPIAWVKDNHTMCDFKQWYPCKYEYILFARRSKDRPLAAFMHSVMEYARSDVRDQHSAAKPVPLLRALIEQSTLPGELVLDPFAGIGSTLVAARDCGRRAVGFEIDVDSVAKAQGRLVA